MDIRVDNGGEGRQPVVKRQAQSGDLPGELLDQHVVSAVLLRRWTVDSQLLVYDLRYDRARLRSPRAEGYIRGFTRVGATEFEARWGAIERGMPPVFRALDGGNLFDDPPSVARLKDFFALHFARSRTLQEVHRRSNDHALSSLQQDEDLRNPARLDELFLARFGLHPAGPGARMAAYEAALDQIAARTDVGSAFFGERVDENFERVRAELDGWGLQIGVARGGAEFVISDDPVQTVQSASGRVGVLAGVTLADADALILPLGPGHIMSASRHDEYIDVHSAGVAKLNSAQFSVAQEKVFLRPGSGLEEAVRGWRAQQLKLMSDATGDTTERRPADRPPDR